MGRAAGVALLVACIGALIERVLIRRLYGRDPLYGLLLTFGLAFMIEDGTRFIWGAQSLPYQIPSWLAAPLSSEYFFLTGYRVFMVILVAVAVLGLFLILDRTRLGLRIRAGTLDLETVSALGVNVRVLRNLNFGLGSISPDLLACSPSACSACSRRWRQSHYAELHRHHCRRAGLAARHASGGLLIGVASGVTSVFFPSASEAVIYVMMAAVSIIRPRGLLGEEGRF